ncbi:Ig-like domain-containing protein [Microbulbifer sp. TYP-18]|uniref:Ig-like domain-containing protein n=1 Tax=Microbulbifer sp. TYP-18 TaxID=3230024 RepID=UPI0034C5E77C
MRSAVVCLCVFLLGIGSLVAEASTGIAEGGYKIYKGDIDGDSLEDLYFEYRHPIILLHGEVVTPIALPGPPNFVLYGLMVGNKLNYSSPVATTLSETVVNGLVLMADDFSLSGDFDGNGSGDLLVLGSVPLILHASDSNNGHDLPVLAQTFPPGSHTGDILSGVNPTDVSIQDVNGDGRDDIVISGTSGTTLLANTFGLFEVNPPGVAAVYNFGYDALGRLTSASDQINGDRFYQYDAAGNRTFVGDGGEVSNGPPSAVEDSIVLVDRVSGIFNLTSNDTDPDGNDLTIISVTQPTNASVSIHSANEVSIIGAEINSTGTFSYTISDGNGAESTASVSLQVIWIDECPPNDFECIPN